MNYSFPSRENLAILFDEYKNLTKTANTIILRALPAVPPVVGHDPRATFVQITQRMAMGESNRERREIFAAYMLDLVKRYRRKDVIAAFYAELIDDETFLPWTTFEHFVTQKIWQKGAFRVADFLYDWTTEIVFPARARTSPEHFKSLKVNHLMYQTFILISVIRDKQIKEKQDRQATGDGA